MRNNHAAIFRRSLLLMFAAVLLAQIDFPVKQKAE